MGCGGWWSPRSGGNLCASGATLTPAAFTPTVIGGGRTVGTFPNLDPKKEAKPPMHADERRCGIRCVSSPDRQVHF
jgi:hypothetical protein